MENLYNLNLQEIQGFTIAREKLETHELERALAFFAFYYAIVLSQMRSGTPMPSGPVPELASTPLFAYGAWLLVRLRSRVALVARRAAARVAGTEGRSDQASTPGN